MSCSRLFIVLSFLLALCGLSARTVTVIGDCSPAETVLDSNALCAHALTGCICVGSGSGTAGTFANCAGCIHSFSGALTCGSQVSEFSCSTELGCGSRSSCGVSCPCTHSDFFPVLFRCGHCQ